MFKERTGPLVAVGEQRLGLAVHSHQADQLPASVTNSAYESYADHHSSPNLRPRPRTVEAVIDRTEDTVKILYWNEY